MRVDLDKLPDDLGFLKQMVRDDMAGALQGVQARNKQLEHQLALLRRHQFGRKSEKVDSAQLLLAFEHLQGAGPPAPPPPPKKPKSNGHGRKPLPADLPRERVEHDLPPEGKRCGKCGAELAKIGEEVTRQLDYVPAYGPNIGTRPVSLWAYWCYGILRARGDRGHFRRGSDGTEDSTTPTGGRLYNTAMYFRALPWGCRRDANVGRQDEDRWPDAIRAARQQPAKASSPLRRFPDLTQGRRAIQ